MIDAPAHEGALWAEQESDDVPALISSALTLKRRWLVKGGVGCAIMKFPSLLHQRCIDGAGSNSVDSNLSGTVLVGRRSSEPYHAVLTSIICAVLGKTYQS